ncbi:hypothetical protein [Saccharothrix violaceirubra]|uniref:hypothetical protein n=1 Tax=Saccharothrix violaceirubra TaxID=413306 RepID=UPI0031EB3F7C
MQTGVRWRLLGGNNRVLGVGVRVHLDQAAALAEIEVVRVDGAMADFTIEHADNGAWWWRLGGLARSAQGFARRVDAELAAARFRDRVADAALDPVLAVFQPGRRGRSSRGRSQRPAG